MHDTYRRDKKQYPKHCFQLSHDFTLSCQQTPSGGIDAGLRSVRLVERFVDKLGEADGSVPATVICDVPVAPAATCFVRGAAERDIYGEVIGNCRATRTISKNWTRTGHGRRVDGPFSVILELRAYGGQDSVFAPS